MDRSEFIRKEILKRYKSIRQFAQDNDLPYTTVKSALDRENGIGRMSVDKALKILSALDIDVNKLDPDYFSSEATLNQDEENLIENYRKLNRFNQKTVTLMVERLVEGCRTQISIIFKPIYDLSVSAGTGQFLDSDNYEMKEFPEYLVPQDSTFAVRVSGDSMEPNIKDGSIVFVRHAKELDVGDVGIFILNNESYIKQLGADNNLISFNPKYKDIIINEYDDLRVVGKVVGEPYMEK